MKKLYFIIFVFFAAVAGMYASDRQAGPEADTALILQWRNGRNFLMRKRKN